MSEYVTSIRVFLEMISNLKTKGYFLPIYLVTKISNFMLDTQAILNYTEISKNLLSPTVI